MRNALDTPSADRPSSSSAEPVTAGGSRCVLVVDGEPLIRWCLAAALEGRGHRVVAAADTNAALRALAEEPIDAVLLDCQLSDRDLELLRLIRRVAPQLPVVGMTACPSRRLRRRADELGAVWLLEKPFDVFSIEEVVLQACEHSRRFQSEGRHES